MDLFIGFDSINICYMHDGAPPHITNLVRQCLDDNYRCWIGRGEGANKLLGWPPRSPDLNMMDFFLWGLLQHRVHINPPDSIEELRNTVLNEANDIPPDMLHRVHGNLKKRLQKCIEVKGELFEHLMWFFNCKFNFYFSFWNNINIWENKIKTIGSQWSFWTFTLV